MRSSMGVFPFMVGCHGCLGARGGRGRGGGARVSKGLKAAEGVCHCAGECKGWFLAWGWSVIVIVSGCREGRRRGRDGGMSDDLGRVLDVGCATKGTLTKQKGGVIVVVEVEHGEGMFRMGRAFESQRFSVHRVRFNCISETPHANLSIVQHNVTFDLPRYQSRSINLSGRGRSLD